MTERSLVVAEPAGAVATAAEIRANVNLIQEVMRAVMQDGTHFGKIPGTQKPTLFKAGSEKILSTFRIAIEPTVDDLSTPDCARYRVICRATTQASGAFLGAGLGECSSDEEKYAYRGTVHDKEWQATPEDRRRIKYTRSGEEIRQVRTNPADVANTVLKMAKKRAQIDATLTVTAASDIFTQDIEDLPEELQRTIAEERPAAAPTPMQAPQRKPAPPVAAPTPHHPVPAAVPVALTPSREPGEEPADPFGDFNTPVLDETAGPPVSDERRHAEDDVRSGRFSAGGAAISQAQSRRLYAIARSKGWSNEAYREQVQRFGFNSDKEVTTVAYEAISKFFESQPPNRS